MNVVKESSEKRPSDIRPDGYFVKIYRREGRTDSVGRRTIDSIQFIGTIQPIDGGEKLPFRGIEELWSLLSDKQK